MKHDWPTQRTRCHALAWDTLQRVTASNGLQPVAKSTDCAQMVAIPVRCDDPEVLQRRLLDGHHIEVPVTAHGGHTFVRIAVQAYNTQADLDALVEALADADA